MTVYKTEERDDGIYDYVLFDDNDRNAGGFWRKREEEWKKELRVPMGCWACGNLMMKWDTQFHNRSGVCANCYYDHIQGRDNLPTFKTNKDSAAYVKARIEEKNTKNKEQA